MASNSSTTTSASRRGAVSFRPTIVDRVVGAVAPQWQLRRTRARIANDMLVRQYDAAAVSRRTQGWRRAGGDANATARDLGTIRDLARDLVRNHGELGQAKRTIANHVVGWGILAKPGEGLSASAIGRWKKWANTTDCDADGRSNLAGLQKLVMHTVTESGECLVRRRWRRLADEYALPFQLQILEPDHLDTGMSKQLPGGGWITNGVEFDALGERVAYWLFPMHPGAAYQGGRLLYEPAKRVPAADVLHIFERMRPGQVRAVSWFAPIILPAKDLDEYTDAQVMKQKIAACLSVLTTDIDGQNGPLATADDTTTNPGVDSLEPGAILNLPAGKTVEVVTPPQVNDYEQFVRANNRKIAKGVGLTYEDYTGDYSQVNFSSARMARLSHWDNVHDWRWLMLIPQFCDPVWNWAVEAMQVAGLTSAPVGVEWTAPGMPMIEPDKEGLAIMRNVRAGIMTLAEAIRERGYDPDEFLAEYATFSKKLDDLKIVLDSDPRHMTQAGQFQTADLARQPVAAGNGGN